ncbi:unnamed protein product [Brassicogethes aeneus]|uniref:DUF7041 domain-containing protein n=1 Tax=Brassicogethes aeneus TaxID=1431903 RepID=A0A9P0ASN3_BRAAE|nr:unnamed protein product [Brassicogethes aeneus]
MTDKEVVPTNSAWVFILLQQQFEAYIQTKHQSFLISGLVILHYSSHVDLIRVGWSTQDSTKFSHVYIITAHLDNTYAFEVKDIILRPLDVDRYKKLKHEPIARFSKTAEQRVRQVLSQEGLGDRTPAQLLKWPS